MKSIIADHSCNAFLKPGEAIISAKPIIISTVLGSCIAVTMYSAATRTGAICHAMLPENPRREDSLLYVENAIHAIHTKMVDYGAATEITIKLFGGAQVLAGSNYSETREAIGDQNIRQSRRILDQLGLKISATDVGGTLGRKLFFSIKTGDVYIRKIQLSRDPWHRGKIS